MPDPFRSNACPQYPTVREIEQLNECVQAARQHGPEAQPPDSDTHASSLTDPLVRSLAPGLRGSLLRPDSPLARLLAGKVSGAEEPDEAEQSRPTAS